jgi:hypothetical protein
MEKSKPRDDHSGAGWASVQVVIGVLMNGIRKGDAP